MEEKKVYICFCTDSINSNHISIIKKVRQLGKLYVGILSDETIRNYKYFLSTPYVERKIIFENIIGVYKVVEQKTFSYKENLEKYKPDYVVYGNNWEINMRKFIRDEVNMVISRYGGKLIEYPYYDNSKCQDFEKFSWTELSIPDVRRGRLKKLLSRKGIVTAMEAHNGLTGLIVENATHFHNDMIYQFDAMWISSLCNSVAKGKPDIELVDMTSRLQTIDEIMDVTTKPVIFDGDTGGLTEHFVYTVRTLERVGVSMIIIEDKKGLKRNSLLGVDAKQRQENIENFRAKIIAGKKAQRTRDFMICARIESLILGYGVDDALDRAFAFVDAGADAIMIHSREKDAADIFNFVDKFRKKNKVTPIVVAPTTFSAITEDEFEAHGINIVIYANQLIRAALPAMQNAAKLILEHRRAEECNEICMPCEEIITLIPEEYEF